MLNRKLTVLVSACGLLFGFTGCGGGGVEPPVTYPVTGKVMYKGKPFADAEIGFVSTLDNKDVKSAHGKTDAQGEFKLTTYLDPDHEVSGATLGDFAVTVVKIDIPPDDVLMKEFFNNPAYIPKASGPTKYGDPRQTPLSATVTTDASKNAFEFNLDD